MKKKWILFLLSPIFVILFRFIISLIFWILWTLAIDTPLLIVIKTIINRSLGILFLFSIPLLIIGIVLLAKNKDSKIQTGEIIQYSRQKSKKYMTRYILWFLILFLLQFLSSYIDWLSEFSINIIFGIIPIVIALLSQRLILWLAKISLSIVYEEDHKISNLFQWFYKTIKYIIAYILSWIVIVLWYILFIIPWIILTFRLWMVPYIILREWLWPIAAIKKSWRMTKSFVWDIFIINIIAWLINILWILALFVWLLWTIPLYMIANAYIYKKLTNWSDIKQSVNIELKEKTKKIIPTKKPLRKIIIKKKSPVAKKTK